MHTYLHGLVLICFVKMEHGKSKAEITKMRKEEKNPK